MTFIEHGLIGGAIVYKTNPDLFWLGVAAGMLPDIPPMALALYKTGIKQVVRRVSSGKENDLPECVYKLYDTTHSFITAALIFLILFFLNKDLTILAVSYGFHIICDIPFHNNRFSTRFLYPLSNFHIHGYSQGKHRWIHIVSAIIILIVYIFLFNINISSVPILFAPT